MPIVGEVDVNTTYDSTVSIFKKTDLHFLCQRIHSLQKGIAMPVDRIHLDFIDIQV